VTRKPPGPSRRSKGWPAESAERAERARALRARGINPYPNRYERTHGLAEIVAAHGEQSLEELERLTPAVRIAGRVMTQRGHGKASFLTLSDGEGRLQVYVRQDDVGEPAYGLLELVDRGDFLGVAGHVMRTRKGELSVQARELTFLSKALLPPPEKWHGLADVEARYRQRYLDLMVNPEVRRTFVARSQIVAEIRRFMDGAGLHRGRDADDAAHRGRRGGAALRHPPQRARHRPLPAHRARAVPEAAGGRRLETVYEINRNFRNEGISAMHNPEFTMLEFYTAYHDVDAAMAITEEIIAAARARVAGARPIVFKEREVSFARPFARLTMKAAVLRAASEAGLGLEARDLDDPARLRTWAASAALKGRRNGKGAALGPERYAGLSHGKLIAQLFEGPGRAHVLGPDLHHGLSDGGLALVEGAAPTTPRPRSASSSTWRGWRSPTASPS
jgi:lysyl-tRNA synthetase class 2